MLAHGRRATRGRRWSRFTLLDALLHLPVIDGAMATRKLGVHLPNVYPPLRARTATAILMATDELARGAYWRAEEVLNAVDRHEEREDHPETLAQGLCASPTAVGRPRSLRGTQATG